MAREDAVDFQRIGLLKLSRMRRREAWAGYLLIAPWFIGFLLFILGPMIASFYYSFTRYSITRPPSFIGTTNYVRALTGRDDLFWHSLGRTGIWALVTVPTGLVGSLLAAILLNQGLKGTTVYRTCFFLPSLTPVVAAALLWRWMLHPDMGVINYFLALMGIRGPGWLISTTWAIWALVMIQLWVGIGSANMLIFLAALQGIPEAMYEAAEIDGAGAWRKTLNITVPMITPAILFNLVMGVLGSFRVFTMAFMTTEGGPAYATYFFALHIYYQAFMYFNMGYACALSWVLFFIVVALTALQFWSAERWVYYGGER